MSTPSERTLELWFCQHLGSHGFRPSNRMVFEGVGEVEFVSFPWPERQRVFINARTTPGDPTTMQRFEIRAGTSVPEGQ